MARRVPPLAALAALLTALAFAFFERGGGSGGQRASAGPDAPGDFDFYVLALSWSPAWCAGRPGDGEGEIQCDPRRPRGFVVHGLWPQRETGWPEFCDSPHGSRIERRIADRMADLMPSRDLVFHQWRKHGACSGLPPDAYFDTVRRAAAGIALPGSALQVGGETSPRAVESAFIAANAGLKPEGVAVICGDGMLREVRVCLNKDLTPRPCAEVDAKACRARSIAVPPPGG